MKFYIRILACMLCMRASYAQEVVRELEEPKPVMKDEKETGPVKTQSEKKTAQRKKRNKSSKSRFKNI